MTKSSGEWYDRWRDKEEKEGLTWGRIMDGIQFYEAFLESGSKIEKENIVCEIGPGYGRIFDTFREKFSFKKWYMIEISPQRSEELKQKYKDDPRVVVLCQNVDSLELPEKIDVGVSTLTLKHLYPDCSIALFNISKHLNKNGFFIFDFIIEDKDRITFEDGNVVNYYPEDTIKKFINLAGMIVEQEGIVDYPVGPRKLYRLGKQTGSSSNLENNETKRETLSLQRKGYILENYCAELQSKLERVKKSTPYKIWRKMKK